ncbi:MAG: DUF4167 domain-containing protein [Alphaproteobacteria bacterium]|nr:DUF4167 domain-containing protein [Alphaproteobacteria bacterium]
MKHQQNSKRPRGGRPNGKRGGFGYQGFGPNRSFDSNGPDIKVRGNASQVYEKYLQMARDAHSAGDRIAAENYLQHAEHYYRIMTAEGLQQRQYQQQQGYGQQGQQPIQAPQGQGYQQGQPQGQHGGQQPHVALNSPPVYDQDQNEPDLNSPPDPLA